MAVQAGVKTCAQALAVQVDVQACAQVAGHAFVHAYAQVGQASVRAGVQASV